MLALIRPPSTRFFLKVIFRNSSISLDYSPFDNISFCVFLNFCIRPFRSFVFHSLFESIVSPWRKLLLLLSILALSATWGIRVLTSLSIHFVEQSGIEKSPGKNKSGTVIFLRGCERLCSLLWIVEVKPPSAVIREIKIIFQQLSRVRSGNVICCGFFANFL